MTRQIRFTKMHGAGNDYVVLDGLRETLPADLEAFARRVGDRHFGIGADQMLVLRAPSNQRDADFMMDIYNADGSRVEMCGNGIRALFKFLRDRGHTTKDEIRVETLGGIVRPIWLGPDDRGLEHVRVDMGRPVLDPAKIPTTLGSGEGPVLDEALHFDTELGPVDVLVSSVSMGNPHAVVVVADTDDTPVQRWGPAIEHHDAFPAKVNVEFVRIVDRANIQQRTWERGTGETLACGSGACAVAVVSMLRGVVDREVTIHLPGGTLEIAWADAESPVLMTGPAAEVFSGTIPEEAQA